MTKPGAKTVEESGLEVVEACQAATAFDDVVTEELVERLVAFGRAISDPIRIRMLGMMADGRGCCDLPNCGVPVEDPDAGICVCEFEQYFGMGQSKVSYHLRKLKDAGLIIEKKRGKWSYYSLNRETARSRLDETALHLGAALAGSG